jgi:hypothetical protein
LLFGSVAIADGLIAEGSVISGWWLVVGGWAIDAYRQ